MPLKPIPFREVKRKLERAGFEIISQKGSHIKFYKKTAIGTLVTVVPNHKEVSIGTLKSVLRQAHLSNDEFDKL